MLKVKGQRKRIGWFPADYVTSFGAGPAAPTAGVNKQAQHQLAVSLRSAF